MADATKAQRILAAKKLVKEYQKKKSKSTPGDSLTNSTHSSLNEAPHIDEADQFQSHNSSPLQQYFSGGQHQEPTTASFFDNIPHNNVPSQGNQDFYSFDHVNFNKNVDKETNQVNTNVYFQSVEDSLSYDDPEIKPNEIYDNLHKHNHVTIEDAIQLNDYLKNDNQVDVGDVKEENGKVEGNMESLKQLSTQIIQLIDDNSVPDGILQSNRELESKYAETLTLLQEEKFRNNNLMEELKIYREKVNYLENDFYQKQQMPSDEKQGLLDEIERHEQTVKFLVAEKSDLDKIVAQRDTELKEKLTECGELNARLKTSRSRVADLERELTLLKESKLRNNIPVEENEKYVETLNECATLRGQRDEMQQDISELQQKLNTSSSENAKLRMEIQELTSQLSLLNIKLQQVTSGDTQNNFQMENLSLQLQGYEKQNFELQNIIKNLSNEKEQAAIQYQQYVQQLNGQLNNLSQKLEEKIRENESLIGRERDLTNQMVELEMLLQKMQEDQNQIHSKPHSNSGVELIELQECLRKIEDEKKLLEESYVEVKGERDEVFKELELKRDEMMQLEDMVSHLRNNQPDSVKLLAEMESDKVAASRAVAQNEELKSQLTEMQNAFIKISNEKLELAEQLSNAKHKTKEAEDQLGHLESQIHTLSDAIAIKDKEMYSLRESAAEMNRFVVQQNQLEDRLRHYEAHDHSTHALQHELQQSYMKLQTLTTENNSLKLNMNNLEDKFNKLLIEKESKVEENDEKSENSSQSLLNKIENLEKINKELELKLSTQIDGVNNTNIEGLDNENISQKDAMKQLEIKFTKMMEEIANLEDEKQRLEHLVLQLQDETETIGEYVTLYQHQRGVLKQRTSEKEEEMRQLAIDKEHMKQKIDQLNNLINRLMIERDDIALDALQHQTVDKSQLCLEHAKVHQEMESKAGNKEFNNNTKTAEKIIELLSEIKTSSLVQSNGLENFHPCPWCSGQLITV
ncbi:golgin subfamily A member 2-like [Onthophagus taurus]|uniref:golgin subfamily A member 2-like n=1 Tax=Onthophagus taurus TaxID=166361 RepID=UPI0039BDEAFD